MYHNKNLVRKKTTLIRWNDEEYNRLKEYQQQTRAPGLSEIIRELTLKGISRISNDIQKIYKSKDEKERSKEKEENSTPPGNAPARPREDFDFYFSQITDDESLRELVEEFLRGEIQKGVDLARKTDLREHFWRWLPKYQAKREIAAKSHTPSAFGHSPYLRGRVSPEVTEEQMLMKRRREEKAAELQRQLDAQSQAADSPEARDAAARVLAKFGKPWHRIADRPEQSAGKKKC